MIELTKRVAPKATPLLIPFLALLLGPLSTLQATVISDLRIGQKPGLVRLVIEFDRPPWPPPSFSVDRNRLRVDLKDIVNTPPAPKAIDGISRLEVSRKANGACIETVFAFTPTDIKTFGLTGPHRFIVDAYRPLPASTILPNESRPAGNADDAATEPSSTPASLPEKSLVPLVMKSGPNPSTASHADRIDGDPEDQYAYHKRYQQRLIAALIAVTSIIAVLLFFLIRTAGGRTLPRQHLWTHQLPETPDQKIEAIDSKIRKLLKTYDRM